MKKILAALLVVATLVLVGCDDTSTAAAPMISSDSASNEYGDYSLGSAKLGWIMGEGWQANQDAPSYSDGKVSVMVDGDNRITKVLAYFNEADMATDYVVVCDGKTYDSVGSIVGDFGAFDADGILEYDFGKTLLHLEIVDEEKGEYYVSLKVQ